MRVFGSKVYNPPDKGSKDKKVNQTNNGVLELFPEQKTYHSGDNNNNKNF